MTTFNTNGITIWEGASQLDGSPIALILTGLNKGSDNTKTGEMLQTFIIRTDTKPSDAVKNGDDVAICGDCKHKSLFDEVTQKWSKRTCYVNVGQAPNSVYKCYTVGKGYKKPSLPETALILANKVVRVGSYGDPAAVPIAVWKYILKAVKATTGYTHQWKNIDPSFAAFVMASADTFEEAEQAQSMGYRTFRVKALGDLEFMPREISCPASEEAGKKTNCAACQACGGLDAKAKVNITIQAHGAGKKNFTKAA